MGQIRDQVFHHRHVWQRIDLDRAAFDFVDAIDTGQRVDPADVHRARAADAFAAGTAEGQGRVDLVFDFDQRVQDHRAAIVHVDEIGIDRWVFAIIRVPAVNLELAHILSAFWLGPGFPCCDPGVLWERKFDHQSSP